MVWCALARPRNRLMTVPAIMSSQTLKTITDELQQAYKAALIQIVHDLEKQQQEELRFYFKGLIPEETTGTLNILRSLENAARISWMEVRLLKDGLCVVGRLDLAKTLTEFEIKRNLRVLLDIYARKRRRSESQCYSSAARIELVAERLVKVTTELDQAVRSLMESSENIQELLNGFEEEIERELSDPWNRLTFLVVIIGEAIAEANEEGCPKPEVLKFCSTEAVDKLYSLMMKLGKGVSWVSW